MLISTRYTSRQTSTAVRAGWRWPRPLRLGLVRRFSLIALSVLAVAAGAGVAAESASATTYGTAVDGSCYYNQWGGLALKTGTFQFSAPGLTLVKEWVRLVDVNGNAQTEWFYMGSASGSPASFGVSSITRPAWKTSSRIQAYFAFYVNGAFKNDAYITTTWYYKVVATYLNGLGFSPQASGSGSSCYW